MVRDNGLQKGIQDGSLRVIRNGIGIEEFGSVEILTIRGLFPLRIASPEFDDYLIVSFVGKTQIFAVNDEELEETDLPGNTMPLSCQSRRGRGFNCFEFCPLVIRAEGRGVSTGPSIVT